MPVDYLIRGFLDYSVAIGLTEESIAFLSYGDIDTKIVQNTLSKLELNHDTYQGIETWQGELPFLNADYGPTVDHVALCEDMIIYGSKSAVFSIIDVRVGNAPSLRKNDDYVDVLNELQPETSFNVSKGRIFFLIENYPGLLTSGFTLKVADSNEIQSTLICKFDSIDNAEASLEAIELAFKSSVTGENQTVISSSSYAKYVRLISIVEPPPKNDK